MKEWFINIKEDTTLIIKADYVDVSDGQAFFFTKSQPDEITAQIKEYISFHEIDPKIKGVNND